MLFSSPRCSFLILLLKSSQNDISRLENLANVLKAAYRGGDIEWWDEEEEEEESSGDYYGEYSDDEDGFSSKGDVNEGSGDDDTEEDEDYDDIIVPAWTKNKEKEKVDQKWDPWLKETSDTEDSSSTLRPTSGGASSVQLKSKVALVKAVITYIMPVATCYFGTFLTDSPWIFH